MKSSAPQTTMSISLAPMIAKRPPEGAQPIDVLYKEAKASGYDKTKRKFSDDLIRREEESGGVIQSMFYVYKGHQCKWFWQEVAK